MINCWQDLVNWLMEDDIEKPSPLDIEDNIEKVEQYINKNFTNNFRNLLGSELLMESKNKWLETVAPRLKEYMVFHNDTERLKLMFKNIYSYILLFPEKFMKKNFVVDEKAVYETIVALFLLTAKQ